MEGCQEAESRLPRDQQDKIAARPKPRLTEEVKEGGWLQEVTQETEAWSSDKRGEPERGEVVTRGPGVSFKRELEQFSNCHGWSAQTWADRWEKI